MHIIIKEVVHKLNIYSDFMRVLKNVKKMSEKNKYNIEFTFLSNIFSGV